MENNSENNFPKFFKDIESYCPEEVSKISEEDAENAIIYGIPCLKIEKGHSYEGYIFLSESLSDNIIFSNKSQETIEKLSIKNIHQMTFNNNTENLKGYKKKSDKEIFFQILIGQKFYDFCMNSKEQLLLAIKGLLTIFQKKEVKSDETIDGHLTQIVNKYDFNLDNKFDNEEFKFLSNKLGISPKLLKIDLDINHDNVISHDELIQYLKLKTSGEPLNDIFKKYSTKENDDEYRMTPNNLKNFFNQVQEEPISDLETYHFKIIVSNNIKVFVDNKLLIDANINYKEGLSFGLCAKSCARYSNVKVTLSDDEYKTHLNNIKAEEKRLEEKRKAYPKLKCIKKITF